MKICVAQTRPVTGDIETNVLHHRQLVQLAASHGAGLVIFPELSLTGYEPALADSLAINARDKRLYPLQQLADELQLVIGAGIPTRTGQGIHISMVLFLPNDEPLVYSKKHLHADELPYFTSGENIPILPVLTPAVAIAICYEITIPEHAQTAATHGAQIYIASVAKTAAGVEKAIETLSATAKKFSIPVLMSNCIGACEDYECGGKTAAWDHTGALKAQLDDSSEGLIIFDTDSLESITVNASPGHGLSNKQA